MKMKIALAKKLTSLIALILLAACSPPEAYEYRSGMAEANSKHFAESISYFERAMKRAPQSSWSLRAAREGARIAYFELKEYKKAAEFYQHIVMYSEENEERFEAQRKLGDIYLENLQDYPRAIMEYSRLAEQHLSDQDVGQNRLRLGRAYYYQNNLFQAESEIEQALKLKIEPSLRFSALMLKGNIFIARKEFVKAASLFNDLIKNHSEKAQDENVPMTLAVCYEEAGEFQKALEVLEGLRGKYNPPEYIELRIKRLKERQRNQPAAKGFRK